MAKQRRKPTNSVFSVVRQRTEFRLRNNDGIHADAQLVGRVLVMQAIRLFQQQQTIAISFWHVSCGDIFSRFEKCGQTRATCGQILII
jgi:hypothetical protein